MLSFILKHLRKMGVPVAQLRSFHDTYYLAGVRFDDFGDPELKTLIENDATFAWLDQDFKGRTVRSRVVSWIDASLSSRAQ